jgi:hypothetical protein
MRMRGIPVSIVQAIEEILLEEPPGHIALPRRPCRPHGPEPASDSPIGGLLGRGFLADGHRELACVAAVSPDRK